MLLAAGRSRRTDPWDSPQAQRISAAAAVPSPMSSAIFASTAARPYRNLKLHYTTLGDPGGTPVLLLHGTQRQHGVGMIDEFSPMFAPGARWMRRRDTPHPADAIGSGGSSKPSDEGKFPRYNYDDMVAARYRSGHRRPQDQTSAPGDRQSPMGGMNVWSLRHQLSGP